MALKLIGQIERFQGPKTHQIGEFKGPKIFQIGEFQGLKCQNLPDMAHEPCESKYIIGIPKNLVKLFSFLK